MTKHRLRRLAPVVLFVAAVLIASVAAWLDIRAGSIAVEMG